MSALEWCESRGRTKIKILDTNNRYSYGGLQFQMRTFLGYAKEYGIEVTEEDIYDIEVQRKVAWRMLEDGGSYHWKNCTKKIGPYPTSSKK